MLFAAVFHNPGSSSLQIFVYALKGLWFTVCVDLSCVECFLGGFAENAKKSFFLLSEMDHILFLQLL